MQNQHIDEDELKYPEAVSDTGSGEVELHARAEQFRVMGGPLLHPLLVTVERLEDDQILVSDELLNCYGVGSTLDEATDDLAAMLFEHQADLAESRSRLSTNLRRQLNMLNYFLGASC
jgi:hypothetical protein